MEKSPRAVFKELGIPGLKPERLEVVSAIFKGDMFAILPTGFGKLCLLQFKSFLRERAVVDARAPRPLFFPHPPEKKKSWAGDARLHGIYGMYMKTSQ